MSTLEARLAQLTRISRLVLELPPEDKANLLALLMPAPLPVSVPAPIELPRKRGRPAKVGGTGSGRVVMTKKWGAYRMRHKVTNNLAHYRPAYVGSAQISAYRAAMVERHGEAWVNDNAKRLGI